MRPLILLVFLFALSFTVGLSGALSPGPLLVVTIDSSLRRGWFGGVATVFGHFLVEGPLIVALAYGVGVILSDDVIKAAITIAGGIALLIFGGYTAYSSRRAELRLVDESGTVSQPPSLSSSLNSVLSGVVATVTNPFYWIWWVTVGLAMLTYAPLIAVANVDPALYLLIWHNFLVFLAEYFGSSLSLLTYPNLSSATFQYFSRVFDFNYIFLGSTLAGWLAIVIGHFFSDVAWYASISFAVAKGKVLISVKWYQRIMFSCGAALVLLGLWFIASLFL